jgi:YgiT-type zinc finger domain-containing protein
MTWNAWSVNGETSNGKATVTFERGESIVVIKGVVASICDNCGEYYLDQETTEEVLQKANDAYKKGAEIEVINMRKTAWKRVYFCRTSRSKVITR